MKKLIAAFAFATSLGAVAPATARDTYTFPTAACGGVVTSPIYCDVQGTDGNGNSLMLWESWGTSLRPPAVGQTFQLTVIWVYAYSNSVFVSSGVWYPGIAGSNCYGTISNTGIAPKPYVVAGNCPQITFSDGSVRTLSFTLDFGTYATSKGPRWLLEGGTATVD